LVGFELGDTARALGQMPLQLVVDRRLELVLNVVGEKTHEIGTGALGESHNDEC
jgi:hypothetical protein